METFAYRSHDSAVSPEKPLVVSPVYNKRLFYSIYSSLGVFVLNIRLPALFYILQAYSKWSFEFTVGVYVCVSYVLCVYSRCVYVCVFPRVSVSASILSLVCVCVFV